MEKAHRHLAKYVDTDRTTHSVHTPSNLTMGPRSSLVSDAQEGTCDGVVRIKSSFRCGLPASESGSRNDPTFRYKKLVIS